MSGKYAFVDAECATLAGEEACAPTVTQMCEWLGVSKSGYYEWRSRPQSALTERRELLKIKIVALFEANDEEYGYRRMRQALIRGGEQCCPDLVNRNFAAEKPGEKMAGDITYIPTWEGWVYLAMVIDFATRKLVGWAMADNYRTPLISEAIRMAARNLDLPEGVVFHSDRGSNYTSAEFAGVLKALSITQSVGRTGICFDNAISESWNGTLKTELVHRKVYATRKAAMDDIARWIELRYNQTRLHSALGYRTPQEVMDEYLNGQAVA